MPTELPPFAAFVGAALLVPFLRGWARVAVLLGVPVASGLSLVGLAEGTHGQIEFLEYTLSPFRVDRLSLLFAYIFHIAAFLGNLFSLHLKDEEGATLQHVSALLYAGSALGAVFAGDLITLFVFWELLALASVFLIWARRDDAALRAGMRYMVINVTSGLLLLAGALIHVHETGEIAFGYLGLEGTAGWLIFVAFGIKSAFPLLHNWLTDSYPEATVTGAVFMTAFTTKSAVYVLIRGFAGTELLVWLGAVMAIYGVVYAVLENDARRLLAYHIISQVGYMVCGVGIGTELALNGATAHAFAHILYKALLFMGAGAVLHVTGRRKLSEMGGLYKTMPLTFGLYMVGAFAISAVPLFSGFVSKSMVVSAAGESQLLPIFLMLTLASSGTFLHTGLKLPYYMFFGEDSGLRAQEPPRNMLVAMGLAAVACVVIGVFPGLLYGLLPHAVEYAPYTLPHVTSTLGLLAFTALGFFLLLSHLAPEPTISLDTDWVYRRLAPRMIHSVAAALRSADVALRRPVLAAYGRAVSGAFRTHGPHGPLARTWPTGSMVFWVAVLLVAYLAFELW